MPPSEVSIVSSDSFCNLTGRKAVVTGSSSGIGRAIALELAKAGADVVVHCGHSVQAADEICKTIRMLGRQSDVIQADLGQVETLERFVRDCEEGLGQLDIWINNAGADLLTGSAAQLSYQEKLDLLHRVDVRGTAILSRLAGERMRSRGEGCLINIGWDQADRGMEGDSGELFSAAKNAIMGLSRSLAVSLAPEVRVNCIAPGWIRTAWGEQASDLWQERVLRETPLKRWGTPEDIAAVVRFLVSSEARYVTGQVINVNGGAVR